jgi:hypothetical protein
VRETAQEWQRHLHPRALSYFKKPGMLEQLLTTIAANIDKNADPVHGSHEQCVVWRGDIMQGDTYILAKDRPDNADDTESSMASTASEQESPTGSPRDQLSESQAVFWWVKPGEDEESVTYVNRILSFAFAAEESFEWLMRLPKKTPFKMSCGNQLCIHIGHISVEP